MFLKKMSRKNRIRFKTGCIRMLFIVGSLLILKIGLVMWGIDFLTL